MEGATVDKILRKNPYALDVDVAGLALAAAAAAGARGGRVGVHLREHAREELRLFLLSEFWVCVCVCVSTYEFWLGGWGGGDAWCWGWGLWRVLIVSWAVSERTIHQHPPPLSHLLLQPLLLVLEQRQARGQGILRPAAGAAPVAAAAAAAGGGREGVVGEGVRVGEGLFFCGWVEEGVCVCVLVSERVCVCVFKCGTSTNHDHVLEHNNTPYIHINPESATNVPCAPC